MTQSRKFNVVGISALFLAASAFLVLGGPLGTLVRAENIPVTEIAVSAVDEATRTTPVSTIEVDNGTIRMIATITPVAPTDAAIVWTVENGTGSAIIDRCGQLFAIANGEVTVTGTSASTPAIFGTKIITITNQLGAPMQTIDLHSSANFAILAKTGISTTGATHITGDIGVSPAAATYITGFDLIADSTNVFSTSAVVTGRIYASNYSDPTPDTLTTAIGDMGTAYTTGMGLVPDVTELYTGDLSGKTLTGGAYKWSTDVLINTDLTLSGSATDTWIFQITGKLTEAENMHVILAGGALAKNIFWVVADTVAIGVGAHIEGNIIAQTNISMGTGSSINGRLLAQTAVTLDATTVVLASWSGMTFPANYMSIAAIIAEHTDAKTYTTRSTVVGINGGSIFLQDADGSALNVYHNVAPLIKDTLLLGNVVDASGAFATYNLAAELNNASLKLVALTNATPIVPTAIADSAALTARMGTNYTLSGQLVRLNVVTVGVVGTPTANNYVITFGTTTVIGYSFFSLAYETGTPATGTGRTAINAAMASLHTAGTTFDVIGVLYTSSGAGVWKLGITALFQVIH